MLLRLVLITEIFSVIICIHRIYGVKVKFDMKTVLLFLGLLIVLEIVNTCQVSRLFSLLVYFLIFLYCVLKFKKSLFETIINNVLYLVVMTLLQFACLVPAAVVLPQNEYGRGLLVNCAVLLICIFVLPKFETYRFSKWMMQRREKLLYLSFGMLCIVALFILFQAKILHGLMGASILLLFPIVVLVFVLIKQWQKYQKVNRRIEEKQSLEENNRVYEDFLIQIRMRQHEINNHITAVLSMHHLNKTYEELVRAQEAYLGQIAEENRYNRLLVLGDSVVIGFLYGKLHELEEEAEVTYEIEVSAFQTVIPAYYLIQMLGILLDNGVEAVKGLNKLHHRIHLAIRERETEYEYEVRNPFPYVPFNELESWFALGKSKKGAGRGIGLYHLKYLCEELKCDLICRNKSIGEENWISFLIRVKR